MSFAQNSTGRNGDWVVGCVCVQKIGLHQSVTRCRGRVLGVGENGDALVEGRGTVPQSKVFANRNTTVQR